MNKKNRIVALLISVLAMVTVSTMFFTSCELASTATNSSYDLTAEGVYAQIVEMGYTGSFEEFINAIKGEKGEDGKDGVVGKDGRGIANVEINENYELIITFTDETFVNLGVVRGNDGLPGANGKSAYEIYCEYHPEYNGTEQEWINAIITGTLTFEVDVTFDVNGGSEVAGIKADFNTNLLEVLSQYESAKENYQFMGWTYADGSAIGANDIVPAIGVEVKANFVGDDVVALLTENNKTIGGMRVVLHYGDNLLQALMAIRPYEGAISLKWEHGDGREVGADETVQKAEGIQFFNAVVEMPEEQEVTLTFVDGGVAYDGAEIYNSKDSSVNWYYNGALVNLADYVYTGEQGDKVNAQLPTPETYDSEGALATHRYGYNFKGWYYEDGTEFDGYYPEQSATVYARWEQNGTLIVMYDETKQNVVKAYILEVLDENTDATVRDLGVIDYTAPTGYAVEGWKFMDRETATDNGYVSTGSEVYMKDQFGMYSNGMFYYGIVSTYKLTNSGLPYFCLGTQSYLAGDGNVKKAVYKFYASLWDEKYSNIYYYVNSNGLVEASAYYTYKAGSDNVVVTTTATEVTIPATYHGLPVIVQKGSGSSAKKGFDGANTIRKVTIEEGVREIGSYAFQDCIALEEVVFEGESKMEVIGHRAFAGCTVLKKIDMPASVKVLGAHAFAGSFASDAELNFDFSNVTALYGGTFYQANGKSLTISGLKEIPGAVKNATSYLPSSSTTYATYVTSAEDNIVTNFTKYWANSEESSSAYYGFINGESNSANGFFGNSTIATINIAEGVEKIGSYAFAGCSAENFTLNLPESVTELGHSLLMGSSIVEFYSNATAIPNKAFKDCTELTNYTGDNYVSIGTSAFEGCSKLKMVRIPSTLQSIDDTAFAGCPINDVTCSSANTHYSYDRETKFLISLDTKSIVIHADASATEIVLPEGIAGLGGFYKGNTTITKVILPKSIVKIDDSAFEGCSNLAEVVFPTYEAGEFVYLTELGSRAFYGTALVNVTVPAYVVEVGDYAFAATAKLSELVFEKGSNISVVPGYLVSNSTVNAIYLNGKEDKGVSQIVEVKAYAFTNAKSLTLIDWGGEPEKDENGEYVYKMKFSGGSTFNATNIVLTLPANLTEVGAKNSFAGVSAFVYPEGLQLKQLPAGFLNSYTGTTFVLPACVEQIGTTTGSTSDSASGKLTHFSVEEGSKLHTLGYYALNNFMASGTIDLTNCTLLRKVDANAFYNCKNTILKLPGDIQEWGRTFEDPTSWTSAPKGTTAFGSTKKVTTVEIAPKTTDGIGTAELDGLFMDQEALVTVTLPEGMTRIGKYAFAGCKVLKTINIPSTVKVIDEYAFYCESATNANKALTAITLPEGLETIAKGAFARVYIANLTIPANVKTIGDYAFYQNTSLVSATVADNSNLEYIGANAFNADTKFNAFTIPASVKTIGDTAFAGCTALALSVSGSPETIGNDAFLNVKALSLPADENGFMAIGSTLYGYVGNATELEIPAKYDFIERGAFKGNTTITKLSFANSEIEIRDDAFLGCTALTEVTLPENATLGVAVFAECTALTSVTIPDGWTVIPVATFANTGITQVNFGEDSKLETIGEYAFYNCASLTSFMPPKSIKVIDGAAFALTGLTEINWTKENIPALEVIGDGAFAGLTLTNVNIETGTSGVFSLGRTSTSERKTLADLNSVLDKGYAARKTSGNAAGVFTWATLGQVVISVPNAEELIFGEGTTAHGYAFAYAKAITEGAFTVTLNVKDGAGFAMGGSGTFKFSEVSEVNFPENAVWGQGANKPIGSASFESATKIKEIYIPAYLSRMSSITFKNATSLEKVVIGDGVNSLDTSNAWAGSMFYNCTSLKSVIINQPATDAPVKCATNTTTTSMFYGIYETVTVYVNAELVDEYEANANWMKHTAMGLKIQAIAQGE